MTYRQGIGWLLIALGVLLMLALMLAPRLAQAQAGDPPAALTVTIRDTHGQGVSNVRVLVLARSGSQVFAQATTDASGQARIEALPTGDARVVVEGQWQGRALTKTGADAGGVLLVGDLPAVLDLQVLPDGLVIPDPATMIAPDLAGPSVPIPTASVAVNGNAGSGEPPELPEATTLAGPADAGAAGGVADAAGVGERGAPVPVAVAQAPDGRLLVLTALALLACLVLTIAIARWVRPA